jgi:hypothetical protein
MATVSKLHLAGMGCGGFYNDGEAETEGDFKRGESDRANAAVSNGGMSAYIHGGCDRLELRSFGYPHRIASG